jgi:hypothetical protein
LLSCCYPLVFLLLSSCYPVVILLLSSCLVPLNFLLQKTVNLLLSNILTISVPDKKVIHETRRAH